MFTYNSMEVKPSLSNPLYFGSIMIFGILSALWFRGRFWNYLIVMGLELFLAIFIAVSFPVFEMILEAILNDKLKKVGDKIRAQHKAMDYRVGVAMHYHGPNAVMEPSRSSFNRRWIVRGACSPWPQGTLPSGVEGD